MNPYFSNGIIMPILVTLSKALILLFALKGSAFAEQPTNVVGSVHSDAQETSEKWLSVSEIVNNILKLGYHDINEIELSDDGMYYEIDAYTRGGQKVEIELDAVTGAILEIDEH